jgi:hypothetical protein
MKTSYALSFLALAAVAACSESPTSPSSTNNFTPRYGTKPSPTPPPTNPIVCPAGASCMTFDGFSASAEEEVGIASVSTESSPSGEAFAGRFTNQSLSFTPGIAGPLTLTFNLYIIGAWDGDRKKGPDQLWQLLYNCGGTTTTVINATFANRLGDAQSFPYNTDTKGKHGGGMDTATGLNTLGYQGSGLTATYSENSGDVGDSRYAIQRTIPACQDGSTPTITMLGQNLTTVTTASWGVDNISVQPAA